MASLFRTFQFTDECIKFDHDKVKTKEIDKEGKKSTVGYVTLKVAALQLGDDRNDRMVAPFGLSGLYPGEKEEYTRNLELLIPSEALQDKIREMDAFFQAAFQANSRV